MKRSLHIGFFVPGWPANEYPNGIVTYVRNLRAGLMSEGHRVSVFTGRVGQTNKDSGVYRIKPTVKHRILVKLTGLVRDDAYHSFNWGRLLGATVNEVNRTDPLDIFEMEESFGWCADVQELVPVPVIVKLHGPAYLDLVEEARDTPFARTKIEREGRALRKIAAIVSPSLNTLDATVSRYGLVPRLRRVIPNPVVVDAAAKQWNVQTCDRKTILFVGRFDKRKGGDTVLTAFRRLLEMDAQLKLVFVGPDRTLTSSDGSAIGFEEFRDSLFTEAQRASIRYLGQLPPRDVHDLRTKAMLTMVASRWENQPNTALEAMMQACPVVASDTGGMSEIIENRVTGLLARADDIEDLCAKVMEMLNDPAAASRMGENARRSVTERHSLPKLTQQAVDAYYETISMIGTARRMTGAKGLP